MKVKYCLIVIATILTITIPAYAADASGTCGDDLTWTFEEATGTLTISGTGAMSEWNTASSAPWHSYRSSIQTVLIEEGVTNLECYSFSKCSSLTSVSLPNSLQDIGTAAFEKCYALESIHIPAGVSYISTGAFGSCKGLSSVTIDPTNVEYCVIDGVLFDILVESLILYPAAMPGTSYTVPSSVIAIENQSFSYATCLQQVTLPTNLASIKFQAFYGCSSLQQIDIPATVQSIGSGAFWRCSSLTSVVFPESLTRLESSVCYGCTNLQQVTIPSSTTYIGWEAFCYCEQLTGVYIPASVSDIGDSAFSACSSMTTMSVDSNNTYYDSRLDCNAIIETSSNTLVAGCKNTVIPEDVSAIGKSAFSNCRQLESIHIPDSVTVIGDNAFYWCQSLDSVVLPPNLSSIGKYAFASSGVKRAVLPESVTSVASSAFTYLPSKSTIYTHDTSLFSDNVNYMSSRTSIVEIVADGRCGYELYYVLTIDGELNIVGTGEMWGSTYVLENGMYGTLWDGIKESIKTVVIEEGCTAIGFETFRDCSAITSVALPDSLEYIEENAFAAASNLLAIVIPESVTSIGRGALSSCEALTSAQLPTAEISLGDSIFYGCKSLTNVSLAEGTTSIPENMFSGCGSLASFSIPNSVTEIGCGAFYGCTSLASINFHENISTIGSNAFMESGIEQVVLHSGITLEYSAFQWCPNLTSAVIYGNVPEWCFAYCPQLELVTLHGDPAIIESYAFYNCTALESVTVPESVTSVGENAFVCLASDSVVYTYDASMFEDDVNYLDVLTTIIEILDEGQCGDDLEYRVLSGASMSIWGTGPMWDFTPSSPAPYYPFVGSIISVTFDEGATSVGDYAFYHLGVLESLTLPSTLTDIGAYAFSKCGTIESISLPNAVVSIGESAFQECGSLKTINLPTSLILLGNGSFKSCYSLLDITIPSGVTTLGEDTFAECSSLATATLGNNLTSIGDRCFYNNCSLSSISVPSSVEEIGDYAFASCDSLESISIPTNIRSLGTHVCEDCGSLKTVSIPTTLSKIPDYTFAECTYLETLTIPSNITEIGTSAFQGCVSLDNPTLPDTLATIGDYAYDGCISIGHLNTPAALSSVGTGAFTNWSEGTTIKTTTPALFIAGTNYTSPNTTIMVQSTLNVDYNDGGATASKSYKKWTFETVNLSTPTRTGYDFQGWSTPVYGSLAGTTYTFGDTPDVIDTVTAQWVAKTVTVTWDANGGTGGTTSTQTYGTALEFPAVDPSYVGHTFAGWYSAPTSGYKITSGLFSQTTDVTYYARWTANYSSVVINPAGGLWNSNDMSQTISRTYGTVIDVPDPIRTGYIFDEWTVPVNGVLSSQTYTFGPADGAVDYLTAQWTAEKYQITWNLCGAGTSLGTFQEYDALLEFPMEPAYAGHTFKGWYTAATGGSQVPAISTYKVASESVYYAHWEINQSILQIDPAGGDWNGSGAVQTFVQDYATTVNVPDPVRAGHTFNGWVRSGTNGTLASEVFTFGPNAGATDTLTASWLVNTYPVTYISAEGSEVVYQTYGQGLVLPTPTSKAGYNFDKWYTQAVGGTALSTSNVYLIEGPSTYYAQYTPLTYTTTWVKGDGSSYSVTQTYDATIVIPSDPEKAGHEFTGWYTASSGGDKVESTDTYSVVGNSTYYAQFTPNTYTVTWDDGTTTTSSYQTFGTAIVLPAAPSKAGTYFDGWYTDRVSGSKITSTTLYTEESDTTYYARFIPIFSVTVPTTVPIVMAPDGSVTCSDLTFTNNSGDAVVINDISVSTLNGWSLVSEGVSMARAAVDSKQISLTAQGEDLSAEVDISGWVVPYQGTMTLVFDAEVSANTTTYAGEEVLQIVFVISWVE